MPRYLYTKGRSPLAIAICDRCRRKVPYSELRADGNSPGLRVCNDKGCWDRMDPWRLPARQPEQISLRNPRLDTRLGFLTEFLVTESESLLLTENDDYLILSNQSEI